MRKNNDESRTEGKKRPYLPSRLVTYGTLQRLTRAKGGTRVDTGDALVPKSKTTAGP